jgi:metallo-beta-lactamase class B
MRKGLLAALILTSSLLAQSTPLKRYDPDWNRPATPHQVIGPIYFVGTNNLAVFLITTPEGHILMDPGYEETVPLVKASIRTLGFKYEDIKVLLNTQAHFDHAAGLAQVKRETGARLMASAADAELLEAGGRGDFLFGDRYTFPPVKVDRVFKDGEVIELGNARLTARLTPGHTKGATTFTMTADERGRAYQVIFAASTTINDGTRLIDNPTYPHIVEDWERAYAILESLSPGVWVSQHTNVFDETGKLARQAKGGDNPYIDLKGYRSWLFTSRQRFTRQLAGEIARHAQ